ncbi:MAG: peptidase M55 [Sulfobacillus benefaciens]|uniref:Peptidase M55 n=1 Tax=Sulfobacillus benefaciens TaxID=453960 RepID=A0A2T2XFN2_9FIRM|nr:MAG: peptidase M55 [Sulfobacillus benefaciens]
MIVWLSVDMEGISGIVERSQLLPGELQYETGRKFLMSELHTVLAALKSEPDVSEIIVNDSHDGMVNLMWDQIPDGVRLISGGTKAWSMNQGTADADVGLFVGYHAKAGTAAAVMDHTYAGQIFRVRLNGREVGETGINAAVAGHFGVPIAMISGDDKLCLEAGELLPEAVTVMVKEGVSRNSAKLYSTSETSSRLASGVKDALARFRRSELKPFKVSNPAQWEITLMTADMADRAMYCPGMERVDGRTVSYQSSTVLEGFRAFYTVMALTSGRPLY